MVENIASYGNNVSQRSVNIVPQTPGQVKQILFSDGQTVVAGAALVLMDASIAQAQVQASRAQSDTDTENLRRTQSLSRQGLDFDLFAGAGAIARLGVRGQRHHRRAQAGAAYVARAFRRPVGLPPGGRRGLRAYGYKIVARRTSNLNNHNLSKVPDSPGAGGQQVAASWCTGDPDEGLGRKCSRRNSSIGS